MLLGHDIRDIAALLNIDSISKFELLCHRTWMRCVWNAHRTPEERRMLSMGLVPFHTCWNFAVSILQCLRGGPGSSARSERTQAAGPGSARSTRVLDF
eukprot:3368871-Amphidinium_carterae.1